MARMGRPGLSDDQNVGVWRRWHSGDSPSDIGRALSKYPPSIFGVLRLFCRVTTSATLKRRASSMSLHERDVISRGLASSYTIHQITCNLNRSPLIVSHEICRNDGVKRYRVVNADDKSRDRRAAALALCPGVQWQASVKLVMK